MLRQENYLFRRMNQMADAALAVGALVVAHYVGQRVLRPYVFPTLIEPSRLGSHAWAYLAFPVLTLVFAHWNGLYHSEAYRNLWPVLRRYILTAAETALAAALISYATYDGGVLSRALVVGGAGWLALLLAAKTLFVRAWLRRTRRKGRFQRTLLLVGSGDPLRHFADMVRSHPVWGFRIVGVVSDDEQLRPGQSVAHVPVVERLSGLVAYLERHSVDEVVFVPSETPLAALREPLEACELMGIRTRLSLNFFEQRIGFARPDIDAFEGTPVVTYSPAHELTDWRLLLKYGADRVVAGLLLVLLSPLFLVIWLAIKLSGPSWGTPAFFGQRRSGLRGREFTCWKFRSMHPDADRRLEELRAANEMSGPVFKMKLDPRVTRVGRLLRKTSLDELPQLWNVFVGEMSLVGPRPPIPEEVARYDRWQRRRLSMKPGITCIWQVSGRNLLDFDTWMKMDLEYIDNWSLWLDVKILARTVLVVLTGYGAM